MKEEIILDVPFKEKDEVKMLGARWDPGIRKWYVPANQSAKPFARWIEDDRKEAVKDDLRRNNRDSY